MPSHGALSKAGKVRSITPKTQSKKRGSSGPRVNNRKLYYKRYILARDDQYSHRGKRRGRSR